MFYRYYCTEHETTGIIGTVAGKPVCGSSILMDIVKQVRYCLTPNWHYKDFLWA